jgi:hypothetical protein
MARLWFVAALGAAGLHADDEGDHLVYSINSFFPILIFFIPF